MFFSLFRNEDTVGEVRYGLACSNIISSIDTATPLIPLCIYTLLGNANELLQPTFTIPPIETPVIIQEDKPLTRSKFGKFVQSTVSSVFGFKQKLISSLWFSRKRSLKYTPATPQVLSRNRFFSSLRPPKSIPQRLHLFLPHLPSMTRRPLTIRFNRMHLTCSILWTILLIYHSLSVLDMELRAKCLLA